MLFFICMDQFPEAPLRKQIHLTQVRQSDTSGRLDLQKIRKAKFTVFATVARVLEAEGACGIPVGTVDIDHSDAQPPRRAHSIPAPRSIASSFLSCVVIVGPISREADRWLP